MKLSKRMGEALDDLRRGRVSSSGYYVNRLLPGDAWYCIAPYRAATLEALARRGLAYVVHPESGRGSDRWYANEGNGG